MLDSGHFAVTPLIAIALTHQPSKSVPESLTVSAWNRNFMLHPSNRSQLALIQGTDCFLHCLGDCHDCFQMRFERSFRRHTWPLKLLMIWTGDRLDWECGKRTKLEEFKGFDCDWQGSHLWPRDGRPRKEKELNVGNKDVWWDSVELREVCTPESDCHMTIMTPRRGTRTFARSNVVSSHAKPC